MLRLRKKVSDRDFEIFCLRKLFLKRKLKMGDLFESSGLNGPNCGHHSLS